MSYFYTTKEKLEKATEIHGSQFLEGCRIVLGDSVPLGNGKFREKGVDALLVADLVYHAAQKNCSYAVVVSNDSDFAHALRRVEDFGCNTGVIAIGVPAAERLQNACDDYHILDVAWMIKERWATELPKDAPDAA
ncbi:MAG: NYN domain-containing protein [Betaproteobacteria bacterium]|nr:NYN domain-containing protein [Betaproteobacteria bacterium]